jgi:hypothetical protein
MLRTKSISISTSDIILISRHSSSLEAGISAQNVSNVSDSMRDPLHAPLVLERCLAERVSNMVITMPQDEEILTVGCHECAIHFI